MIHYVFSILECNFDNYYIYSNLLQNCGVFMTPFPRVSQNFISHISASAVNVTLTVIYALLLVKFTGNMIFLHFYVSLGV